MSKTIERGFFSSVIKLSDAKLAGMPGSVEPTVQVLRVGKFNHPKYGEFEITTQVLAEMKANYDLNIRGVDIALDYFHNSAQEASGWLKELWLSEDGLELWAQVDWTPKATKMLAEREIRYFSPDFAFKWTDPESGKSYNNVLFGGGLTNRPFLKDMAAIVASEEKEAMDLKELEAKVLKLSEDMKDLPAQHEALKKAHADLQAQHGALQKKLEEMDEADGDEDEGEDGDDDSEPADMEAAKKQLADMKTKLAEYAEKEKAATASAQMAEKKSKFAIMLSEGKACVAQEKAFLSGDMEEFVKLSQSVNLSSKGHGGGSKEATGDDRDDKVLKLAEAKQLANPKLDRIQALTLANAEI